MSIDVLPATVPTVPAVLIAVGLSMFALAALLTLVQRITGLDSMFAVWCLLASVIVFALPIAGVASGVALTSYGIEQRGGPPFAIGLALGVVFALFGVAGMIGFGKVLWERVLPAHRRELIASWVVGSIGVVVLTVRVLTG